jgi:hypothetical protein
MTPRQIAEQMEGEGSVTFQITGAPRQLAAIEKLLGWVQRLGQVGHSGMAEIFVDGDGSARIQVSKIVDKKSVDVETPEDYDGDNIPSKGPEYKICLD